MLNIYGKIRRIPVCRARIKNVKISVSDDFSLLFCHDKGIFIGNTLYSFVELLKREAFLLKGGCRIFYIIIINFKTRLNILFFKGSYIQCNHLPKAFTFPSVFFHVHAPVRQKIHSFVQKKLSLLKKSGGKPADAVNDTVTGIFAETVGIFKHSAHKTGVFLTADKTGYLPV